MLALETAAPDAVDPAAVDARVTDSRRRRELTTLRRSSERERQRVAAAWRAPGAGPSSTTLSVFVLIETRAG